MIGGGRATVFAYGQTGSGKTFTMQGVQKFVADDLFYGLMAAAEDAEAKNSNIKSIEVYVTFFEICKLFLLIIYICVNDVLNIFRWRPLSRSIK